MRPLSAMSEEQRWIDWWIQKFGFYPSRFNIESARLVAKREGWLALSANELPKTSAHTE